MQEKFDLRKEVADFGTELVQDGVANPWNGVAQLIHAQEIRVDKKENQESAGGKTGAFLGNLADLALLTLGTKRFFRAFTSAAAETTAASSCLTFATAGALHGGIFTPSADGMNLTAARFKQAGLEAASMAAVAKLNSRVESLDVASRVSASFYGNSAIGGLNALASEGLLNHRLAGGGEIANQALTFGLLGGGFAAFDYALARNGGRPTIETVKDNASTEQVTKPFQSFERLTDKPIVSPKAGTLYSKGAFNPTVVQTEDGTFHMLFRGQDDAGVSRVFYGSSQDGKNFAIQDEPVLSPRLPDEAKGIEDPRLSRNPDNHNEWWLTATAFDGSKPQLGIWKSTDLKSWEPITPESAVVMPLIKGVREGQTKSGVILDERIDGKMWMYVMRDYPDARSGAGATTFSSMKSDQMTVAHSTDGIKWTEASAEPILPRRPGKFDERVVEPGPPPIMTDKGILMLYNGGDNAFSYKTGWALFDRNNPAKLLARSDEPVLQPELPWEIHSNAAGEVDQKGNLIFTQGLVPDGNGYLVYYGGADSFIGVARTGLNPSTIRDLNK